MTRQFSIRQQVTWLTLAPLFVMAVSLEAFFLFNRFSDLDQSLLERGKLIAHQLAASSEYGVFSNNQAFLQDVAEGVLAQTDVRGVAILNSASETLVGAGEFFDLNKKVALLNPVRFNREGLQIFQPIIPAQVELGEAGARFNIPQVGSVIVEMSRLRTEGLKMRMLWITVVATVLFLALSGYLTYLAGHSIILPIRKLSDAVEAIGAGDFATRVLPQTHINELNTLAQGMNEMAAQLQQERAILQQRVEEATQALRTQKEEAERASESKSHFLAVASHDLRQPLHALGLYIAELQYKVSGAEQQHLVGRVEQSVEALSTLLNALLDISRLDAGAIVPRLQACAVSAMLDRVAADYLMLAGIKNIRLVIRPYRGYVISDPQLLERILMNLVGNAIRYTYPNGCVMVACRRRGNFLRIEVRDNGMGISNTNQGNIFREFFQVSQQQTDTSSGLGLGLAIVDRLVKLLGYRIELRSAPGKGSVFALELPVTRHPDKLSSVSGMPVDAGQQVKKSPLTGKKLLVVDDDPMVLSSTASILVSWGCVVSTATSLTQAKQLLRDGEIWDFIISDYQLGSNESGIDVIVMVRHHQHRQIPCILISGDTGPALVKLASVSGHHLLHKPVRPAKLRSLIIHLLETAA
ncbi:MAG TPA: ATP-binding protein [Gallionella sp.]|jgi:signal transduction histidine kinase|nr:ATP-binding protein [Gallionella sp.]